MDRVQARWYYQGRRGAVPRLIVVHCTVTDETPTGAEAVARGFARGDRKASTHRVCDNNSTVLCVDDVDTAFGAAGANHDGLHLELIGQPTQSSAEWDDAFSRAELIEAGATVREWSVRWGIPLRWLSVDQVADRTTPGLCTHADVSKAFPEVSTGHWDPGPNFPKAGALAIWLPKEDPDMFVIAAPTGRYYLLHAGRLVYISAPAFLAQLEGSGIPTVRPDTGTWQAMAAAYGPVGA